MLPSGVLVIALVGIELAAQSTDPVLGTWELNVAKSKFSPGPAPKSETRTYAMVGQEIKATSKGVDGNGKAVTGEWTVVYDGKDHPMTGSPDADILAVKQTDAYTTEFTQRKVAKWS